MLDNLDYVNELGLRIGSALEAGDTAKFAALMHEHWLHKTRALRRHDEPEIDGWYETGIEQRRARRQARRARAPEGSSSSTPTTGRASAQAMAGSGLAEVRFGFDHDGSVVIARS